MMSPSTRRGPEGGFREEVFNVFLAILLSDRGIISVPEHIRRITSRSRRIPDITITEFWGLRVIIEGRIFESASVESSLINDARKRIEEGLSSVCIAVLYPPELRNVRWQEIKASLEKARLRIKVLTDSAEEGWFDTNVEELAAILRRTYEVLVRDDIVTKAVELLKDSIDNASDLLIRTPAIPDRLRSILGVFGERDADNPREDDLRVCRIASLTFINALIFQEILASYEPTVETIRRALDETDLLTSFTQTWGHILDDINYIPIFKIARELLLELPSGPETEKSMMLLAEVALQITTRRAALKHDLMGRVYQGLLVDSKYFGARYTMIPSATLLLELTFNPRYWDVSFTDQNELRTLKIADLACGTGTLLKAALESVVDDHVKAILESGETPELEGLYKLLVEDVLYGFDVLSFAAHLSASTLALHAPEVRFSHMNLYVLSLGGISSRLGSLDFLPDRVIPLQTDLFGALSGPSQVTGQGDVSVSVRIPELDLCVMNPPFTRSVGGNLLFGSCPEEQRRRMQTKLGRIVRNGKVRANITAGLGSVFVALADKYIRNNGHISLVLPKTLLSGVAWKPTRELLSEKYRVRYIIVSHEPGEWNFSENTKLSECLIIADKNGNSNLPDHCAIINLWRKPKSNIEALTLASLIESSSPVELDSTGICELTLESKKYGEIISIPSDEVMDILCMHTTAFAQTELIRVTYYLYKGLFYLPNRGVINSIMLTTLGDLFTLGFDQRDIHDGFNKTTTVTTYPSFWGHDSNEVIRIYQEPNQYLAPLNRAKPGRHLRDPNWLWHSASNFLIVERLRLNTHCLTSIICNQNVLSTWWTAKVKQNIDDLDEEEIKKIMCLWLNSTLGILLLLTVRTETEGAWVKFKKPNLESLPVLDPRSLKRDQINEFISLYDSISTDILLTLKEVLDDETRQFIDNEISRILNLPDYGVLRELLAREPIVTLKPL